MCLLPCVSKRRRTLRCTLRTTLNKTVTLESGYNSKINQTKDCIQSADLLLSICLFTFDNRAPQEPKSVMFVQNYSCGYLSQDESKFLISEVKITIAKTEI